MFGNRVVLFIFNPCSYFPLKNYGSYWNFNCLFTRIISKRHFNLKTNSNTYIFINARMLCALVVLQRRHKREPESQDPIITASFIRLVLSNTSSPCSVMVCHVLSCIGIIIFAQQTGCVVHAGVHQWECCWKMWWKLLSHSQN